MAALALHRIGNGISAKAVVFIHGVNGHWRDTWLSTTTDLYWPQALADRICLPHEGMGERLGGAKDVGEHVDCGDGAELGRTQNAHDDGLRMSAIECAVAA